MRHFILLFCILFLFISGKSSAETVVWSGKVDSKGIPSVPIKLVLNKKYQIKVSGEINLGKWIQNREKLANDACYEFNSKTNTEKIESIKNSLNITVCDGKYHLDHIYTSEPFIAKQNRIHFWIYDTNYDDNSGSFQVQVIGLD